MKANDMLENILLCDNACLKYVQSLRTPVLDEIMPWITYLGDAGLIWIGWALVLCCFPEKRKTGLLMIFALVITYVISTLGLKNVFARQRPCVQFPEALFFVCPGGFSFPSGHSISSFCAAGVLFFRHEKGAGIALFIALMIAFSRIYLFVHFPFDVLAGGLLGTGTAYALVVLQKKYWDE